MRVLIVEDETASAENLAFLLKKTDLTVEIAGYTESVEQTVQFLSSDSEIDLIFMDIHLSDGSAFNIFNLITVDIPIVFTTAYDQYALDAFKVNSIDYIMKPIKPEELQRALDKFRKRTYADLVKYISSMTALAHKASYPSRLIVPVLDKLIPVKVSDICFIYSTNRHTDIFLADSTKLPVNKPLEQLHSSLDPKDFIRANKQFIVSRNHIRELVVWFDSRLLVRMDIETPENIFVSKNSASELKKWLVE